jgi:hypothetical protein
VDRQPHRITGKDGTAMGRIIKGVAVLVLLGFIGLTGYAYFGNLTPEQRSVTKPVVLEGN